jgi:hypothetical protein
MDGVSAAASVIAIIEAGFKSVQCIRELLSTYKNGPQTVTQLVQDVESLSTVLGGLSQCSLDASSPTTVASLKRYLVACTNELSTFQLLLKRLIPASSSRTNRLRTSLLTVWKDKDLEYARDRIRDCRIHLNLHLELIHTEATGSTGRVLQQILGEVGKIHDRLDSTRNSTTTTEPVGNGEGNFSGVVEPDVMEACSELELSISRLANLVDHDGSTLDIEDAEQIMDDLETLIQSARDQVCRNHCTLSSSDEQAKNEKKRSLRNELRLVEGLVYGAPAVGINRNGECIPSI